jgi:hypothetical protein
MFTVVKGVVSVALQPDSIQQWSPDSLDAILNSLDDPQNADELLKLSTLIDSNDVHFDLEEQNSIPLPFLPYKCEHTNKRMNSSRCRR